MLSSVELLKRRKFGYIRESVQKNNHEADMPSGSHVILIIIIRYTCDLVERLCLLPLGTVFQPNCG